MQYPNKPLSQRRQEHAVKFGKLTKRLYHHYEDTIIDETEWRTNLEALRQQAIKERAEFEQLYEE